MGNFHSVGDLVLDYKLTHFGTITRVFTLLSEEVYEIYWADTFCVYNDIDHYSKGEVDKLKAFLIKAMNS